MDKAQASVRAATTLGWAIVFGLVVDLSMNGPPGLGIIVAATLAGIGLLIATRPRPQAVVFLAAGLALASFAVVRASPVLVGLDLPTAVALFALAGAFAREGDPLRSGLRAYAARALAWTVSIPAALAMLLRPFTALFPGERRTLAVPRALLIALPVGLTFAVLLGSADAVFAELLRAPFEHLPSDDLSRHVVVVTVAGMAFLTLALRSAVPTRLARTERPIEGGELRRTEWISLLVTVDIVVALFVGVQLVTFFGGRRHVLAETGLTFAEYARSGFWQMLAAAALTGLVIAAAWIGGRPTVGRERRLFTALASLLVGLSLVVLASAFQRLVLYETELGYTWPRLIPHAAILLTGALLACGPGRDPLRQDGLAPDGRARPRIPHARGPKPSRPRGLYRGAQHRPRRTRLRAGHARARLPLRGHRTSDRIRAPGARSVAPAAGRKGPLVPPGGAPRRGRAVRMGFLQPGAGCRARAAEPVVPSSLLKGS